MPTATEKYQKYTDMEDTTGLVVEYVPSRDGSVTLKVLTGDTAVGAPTSSSVGRSISEVTFTQPRIDEAHILYMEVTELLRSRSALHQDRAIIRTAAQKLFALFRGEKVTFEDVTVPTSPHQFDRTTGQRFPGDFIANPGKKLTIDVDGVTYERLPVRTRIITLRDTDLLPLLEEYVEPYLKQGDILFISEKVLTITQGRVVDMSSIRPTPLARFLSRHVGNYYGSSDFRGFGHGTAIAMQLFLEEVGYARILCAAAVSAVTRPFGIRGLFYRICGKRAKSVDCPMSFLILEYAHSAKLAPNDPNSASRRLKKRFGCETVILDANYRGAFSLGKSTRAISETFIGKLFRDNPLGQSDEMTPFCIVRRGK